ncbi:hypothetical protein CAPTEDRAFT_167508 [Capitella teleta]|uniref:Probable ATP-dependent RNA helicase DDX46 n=1 Tax=Capitella teleta TaxID=283909 RepID=R7V9R1_CAPTE|nr:hypothetical protein CAPTEDRAFT_167508 [Capitella teleta]|eukprot:ELU15222.1 hypothetical protein CAPTEDRAFT_167508 [Capitella teleta]
MSLIIVIINIIVTCYCDFKICRKLSRVCRSYRKRSRSTSRSPSRRRRHSPERRRHRSRSRDRSRRSRSRDRRTRDSHRRSRSRERRHDHHHSTHSHERSKNRHKKSESPAKDPTPQVKEVVLDKEAEQKRLELEMQKRRERIEQWRAERKKESLPPLQITPPSKVWSLEDDDEVDEEDEEDEKEEDAEVKKEEPTAEEVDPLDAYMQEVTTEVTTKKCVVENSSSNGNKGKVTIITAVAKKKNPIKQKGELMIDNADALEYSSEEEEEDLEETMRSMNKKKKELNQVDHDKIYYRPFRKCFYVEVPEIANLPPEEVLALRTDLESIKVRGKGCPNPVKTWAQCGVSKKVMDCLKRNNFDKPTPIQSQAVPAIMSGRDIIGIARTGSGKTLAFLLPLFRHVLDQPEMEDGDGPIGVILTPTRELAMQIAADARKFTRSLNLRVVCVYGGTGISEQIAELKRGSEIIVCTPGRMIDMLAANSGRVTNLRRCTYIVLDEADRMFDMGFEPQVMRIIDNIRPDRQTVMFSATFPRQMEALARRILQKPIEVQVGGRSVVCSDVEQYVCVLEEEQKLFKLLELLGVYQEQGSVLVFVDKQEHADDLMKNLLGHSYPCMALHGGIDQYDRDSTIVDFKAGNVTLLVATSVAARGLDVKDLVLVVNYDCPNHYEDYVHRCGRTGRAGRHGYAYTFMTYEQARYAGEIIKAMELSGANVTPEVVQLWEEYKAQTEADGKKVKSYSGFHGKGFKFDETEAHLANERKKLQKAALGLQDSDDEDAGMDIEEKIESMFASVKRVTDVAKPLVGNTLSGVILPPASKNKEALEKARLMASRIHLAKNIGAEAKDITQQAAVMLFRDGFAAPQVSSKTIAEQMAEKINAKLGYTPRENDPDKPVDPNQETFKRYEEELEINEFPQTARWKVTSKEALAQICEYSEAGITVRGTYVLPNKEPKDGERRLYLAIEATSEMSIAKAKKEITRLIKEELCRLQNSYQPINKGRYKVV